MNLSSPRVPVDLPTLFSEWRHGVMADLNCVQIGRIQSFNATKQTAEVQIQFKRAVFNQPPPQTGEPEPDAPRIFDYPVLVDCPVFVPYGGGGSLRMPITAGDNCIVLFNDRNIDQWFSTGSNVLPNTPRLHDLSDGLVLVGIRSQAVPFPAYHATRAELIHTAGGKVSIDAKVEIANTGGNLLTAMLAFTAACKNAVMTDGSTLNPASKAAITAAETLFSNLLR